MQKNNYAFSYIERIRALGLQSYLTQISNSGRSRTAKKGLSAPLPYVRFCNRRWNYYLKYY